MCMHMYVYWLQIFRFTKMSLRNNLQVCRSHLLTKTQGDSTMGNIILGNRIDNWVCVINSSADAFERSRRLEFVACYISTECRKNGINPPCRIRVVKRLNSTIWYPWQRRQNMFIPIISASFQSILQSVIIIIVSSTF